MIAQQSGDAALEWLGVILRQAHDGFEVACRSGCLSRIVFVRLDAAESNRSLKFGDVVRVRSRRWDLASGVILGRVNDGDAA